MAAAKSRVHIEVDQHWAKWGDSAERGIMRAIAEVTPMMAEAAKTAEVRRMSNDLANSIAPIPVEKTHYGYTGGIGASDYKAVWFELGTMAHRSRRARSKSREARRKSLKAAGSTSGVKPLHYLRKGLYAGRAVAFERIGRALREASR
jgi:hypothetical protein